MQGRSWFFRFIILAGILGVLLYALSALAILKYGTRVKDFGWYWDFCPGSNDLCVAEIMSAKTAGELHVGDRILAVNGDPHVTDRKLATLPSNTSYKLSLQREESQIVVSLDLPEKNRPEKLWNIFAYLMMSFVFFGGALFAGLLRPNENVLRHYALFCLAQACQSLYVSLTPTRDFLEDPFRFALQLLSIGYPLNMLFSYSVSYRFPPGVSVSKFWAFLRYPLYATGVLILLGICINLQIMNNGFALPFVSSDVFISGFRGVYNNFYIVIGLSAIAASLRNYIRVQEPGQRRRLQWIYFGVLVAIIPQIVVLLLEPYVSNRTYVILRNISRLASILIPVTATYAVLKHRLFDIQIVVRKSVQYLLAKNVLGILAVLPFVGLVYQILSNPDRTVAEILTKDYLFLLLLGATVTAMKFRRRLVHWMDQKFFRTAYDRETILISLAGEIKKRTSLHEISKLVGSQLESAFHPKHIRIYFRRYGQREFNLTYSSGGLKDSVEAADEAQTLIHDPFKIPNHFHFPGLLEELGHSEEVTDLAKGGLAESEIEWLRQMEIDLVVPMAGSGDNLAGLLLLGEKKSEEPYSAADRRLLEDIAVQIAFVQENIMLKEQMDQEQKVKREVLAKLSHQNMNLVKECPACGNCYDSTEETCVFDQSTLMHTVPVDRVVADKYRLEKRIGKGGMGVVYQATDLSLQRRLALKVLMGSMFGDRTALQRFEREAKASARLNHPNIVTVYDYGSLQAEGAYLAMELLDGTTLRSELSRVKHFRPVDTAEWFDQLLDAVKTAHQAGIVHRDLKPENIMILFRNGGKPTVKVLDFGLAKFRLPDFADSTSLTQPGMLLGTLLYMSPEQLSGEEIDARTDIFSLGLILAETLTGRHPFTSSNSTELVSSLIHKSYHLPDSDGNGKILDDILQRCIAKDRNARFSSVAEMQKELIPALQGSQEI